MSLRPSSVSSGSTRVMVAEKLGHARRQAARGHDRRLVAQLREDAPHEPVHAVGLPIDDAGLDGGFRAGADGLVRIGQLDGGQTRGMREQGRGRGLHSRGDDAADEVPVPVGHLDVRGRSEVHHHHRRAVALLRGHRIRNAVGTDFVRCRIVRPEQPPCRRRLGRAHERLCAGQVVQRLRPCLRQLRHDRSQRRAAHLRKRQPCRFEQRQKLDAYLVRRMALVRGHTPHAYQGRLAVHADDGLRVAHVDSK